MKNDIKALKARWQTDLGRSIQQKIHDVFFGLQLPGHGQTLDSLLTEIRKLPGSQDIKNGKDFRGIHLTGGVHELDFSQADFSYAILEFNFVNCDLRESVFERADARGCILSKNLQGARFVRAKLNGCFFRNGDLRDCRFDQASLQQANFEGADLRGSNFSRTQCQKAKFLKADMRHTDFTAAVLKEAVLQEAVIDKTTNFGGANLNRAYTRELSDRSGNIVAKGVDPRSAAYDDATIF